jgi:hypothetical protein
MDSMSLVKALPHGQHGTTYPGMTWEPKAAFTAVASHFAINAPGKEEPKAQ